MTLKASLYLWYASRKARSSSPQSPTGRVQISTRSLAGSAKSGATVEGRDFAALRLAA